MDYIYCTVETSKCRGNSVPIQSAIRAFEAFSKSVRASWSLGRTEPPPLQSPECQDFLGHGVCVCVCAFDGGSLQDQIRFYNP